MSILWFRGIASLFLTAGLLLSAETSQAKVCTSDEVVSLAKQGFSKADISKLCENAPSGESSDQLTLVVRGALNSNSIQEFQSKTIAAQGVALQRQFENSPRMIGYVEGTYSIMLLPDGNGCPLNNDKRTTCVRLHKEWSEPRSSEGRNECDRLKRIINAERSRLLAPLSLERDVAPNREDRGENFGWKLFVARTNTNGIVQVQCSDGYRRDYGNSGTTVTVLVTWGLN